MASFPRALFVFSSLDNFSRASDRARQRMRIPIAREVGTAIPRETMHLGGMVYQQLAQRLRGRTHQMSAIASCRCKPGQTRPPATSADRTHRRDRPPRTSSWVVNWIIPLTALESPEVGARAKSFDRLAHRGPSPPVVLLVHAIRLVDVIGKQRARTSNEGRQGILGGRGR